MSNHSKDEYRRDVSDLVNLLLERDFGHLASKREACDALGKVLGLAGNTVMKLSGGDHCGVRTAGKLRALVNAKPRSDKPRLYVPVTTPEERDYINQHLSPADKREILLIAAGQEDF